MMFSTAEGRIALLKAMGLDTGRIKDAVLRVSVKGIELEVRYFVPDEIAAQIAEEVKKYDLVDAPIGFE